MTYHGLLVPHVILYANICRKTSRVGFVEFKNRFLYLVKKENSSLGCEMEIEIIFDWSGDRRDQSYD